MDFEVTYTEEQQRFRDEVRAWFEANVPPGITRTPSSAEESYANYQQRREVGRKLGAAPPPFRLSTTPAARSARQRFSSGAPKNRRRPSCRRFIGVKCGCGSCSRRRAPG